MGVCGVHRSGIGVAQAIACHRNIHYVDFEALKREEPTWKAPIRRRLGSSGPTEGFILVVDDSAWSGLTLARLIKPQLVHVKTPIKYGALYYGPNGRQHIDFGYERLPHVLQTFESNIFQDCFSRQHSFDLDGIFCPDVPHEIDCNEDRYLEWIIASQPLVVPVHRVGAIITGRIEKYRSATERWLKRHKINYSRLIMLPGYESNHQRNQAYMRTGTRSVSEWKGRQFAALGNSTLYIESDSHQAQIIAEVSGKSVLAWDTQKTWNCD